MVIGKFSPALPGTVSLAFLDLTRDFIERVFSFPHHQTCHQQQQRLFLAGTARLDAPGRAPVMVKLATIALPFA